jgi:hypothetical protein
MVRGEEMSIVEPRDQELALETATSESAHVGVQSVAATGEPEHSVSGSPNGSRSLNE